MCMSVSYIINFCVQVNPPKNRPTPDKKPPTNKDPPGGIYKGEKVRQTKKIKNSRPKNATPLEGTNFRFYRGTLFGGLPEIRTTEEVFHSRQILSKKPLNKIVEGEKSNLFFSSDYGDT